ncbi:MAG: response regulator [Proteobacteria bacterium]|jgi:signal transduction histidine kinase/CheY-like chemotaxis protein|nr:response regulator [Pseudomonadota bacterium]
MTLQWNNEALATATLRFALNASRDAALLDLVGSPIAVFDAREILYVNAALCDALGRGASELRGTSFAAWLADESADKIAPILDGAARLHDSGERCDLHLRGDGGARRWVSCRLATASWDGAPALAAFFTDLESRMRSRAVEEHLRQSQKMEAVGRLAGGIAHDMNNLLGAIMGFASVIQAEMSPADRLQSDVRQILESCKKGRDLTLNLLGFARRGKYRMEQFTLNDRAVEVVKLLKSSIPKKIRIETRLTSRPLPVYGDPSQIHHAIMNLCLNAVDAMYGSGTLIVSTDSVLVEDGASYSPDLAPGRYARLRITDTGAGMEPGVMSMAFEPFFTTKPLGRGSGLGLSMVYGTAVNHGGAVLLESAPEQGTVATLLLPPCAYESESVRVATERRTPSDAARATVLLVDDEGMVRRAGQRLLEKLGYRVLVAEDGLAAVRTFAAKRDEISAVMLDLIMPVMDGAETLAKLKEIDPTVPVLLASGYSHEEQADELLKKGANGFIQKPFDLATLRSRMAELLA